MGVLPAAATRSGVGIHIGLLYPASSSGERRSSRPTRGVNEFMAGGGRDLKASSRSVRQAIKMEMGGRRPRAR